jgi:hypothetical protein
MINSDSCKFHLKSLCYNGIRVYGCNIACETSSLIRSDSPDPVKYEFDIFTKGVLYDKYDGSGTYDKNIGLALYTESESAFGLILTVLNYIEFNKSVIASTEKHILKYISARKIQRLWRKRCDVMVIQRACLQYYYTPGNTGAIICEKKFKTKVNQSVVD